MSKDVYVLAEQRDGVIQKVSIELIGKATELAADLGQKVVAATLKIKQTFSSNTVLTKLSLLMTLCLQNM